MPAAPPEAQPITFPQNVSFQGTWRAYQARLLERLATYLEDQRVHIVAAPGSGKTIFGLEVVLKLNQRTLVLAPTITIRDQWAQRLVEQFLPAGTTQPAWLSTDIRTPRFLTIATYQALHALCSGHPELADDADPDPGDDPPPESANGNGSKPASAPELPAGLAGFKTLVVDEAHHLRAEWWRTLTFVADHLKPTVVALTATPPYDVSPYEWQRYEELCGPVDAEVAIPELVLQGDLSPHQDYVYFSLPDPAEQHTLSHFRISVNAFVEGLLHNADFAQAIAAHPWLADPDSHLEAILDDPEYLSSMVVYLHATGAEIPAQVLHCLGVESKAIPLLSLEWLEILLTHCLYTDAETYAAHDPILKSIHRELQQMRAIERRRVVLRNPSNQAKLLTTSRTKLNSIAEIVRVESAALQQALRCVILTDFIRKADLPRDPTTAPDFDDIGAVPIFETLRRAAIPSIRLGVLCGSLVIVPASLRHVLTQAAATLGIDADDLVFSPLAHDSDYLILELKGTYRQGAVRLITSVFEKGGLTVLIGTKSLLGEGWDAPAVNTLILASFVGSYVLSNQMRGRSIRIDPNCPSKTANVWHLVCVEPGAFGPGEDYDLLARRCGAFAGVHATSPTIENGVKRLGLGEPPFTAERIAALNAQTIARAMDREALRRSWVEALAGGWTKQMRDGLKASADALPRRFVLRDTIAALLVQSSTLFSAVFFGLLRVLGRVRTNQDPLMLLATVFGIAAAVSAPWAIDAVWRLVRHGTVERSMRQIGEVLLEALRRAGIIADSPDLDVHSEINQDGSVYCWMTGGTGRDQAIFTRALREVLSPIENPRYLLATSTLWRFFQENYFAVPEILARKKEHAEAFARQWRKQVGRVQLVFTRSPEGRRTLLRARMRSLSAAFQKPAERLSCWK